MGSSGLNVRDDFPVVVRNNLQVFFGRGKQLYVFDVLVVLIDRAVSLVVNEEHAATFFPNVRGVKVFIDGLVKGNH